MALFGFISRGLRPNPLPRTGSILIFAQVRANLLRCGRSCHSLLPQLVFRTTCLKVLLAFVVCFANRLPKLFPNRVKIMENAHGSHPGTPWGALGSLNASTENRYQIKRSPSLRTIFKTFPGGNLQKKLKRAICFFLFLRPSLGWCFIDFRSIAECVFWRLVGVVGKYWKQ